ncbi:hypothetical protein BLNAU_4185 [Blattamonas nauphoetae]|uniref:Uncharacterized protein n=1 Tax=Blattamonas nauphoetae TaxID=2049346 RepID=A0ABQ9YAT1_9EUKA|nr:hypothetical protein BLNAU_4185 [Blattamonas nauphoetae]
MLTHKSKTAEEMMILPPSSLRALHPVQVAEGRWSSRHPLREGSVVWAGDGAEAEGDGKDQHCSVGRCDRLEPFRLPKNKICTYPHPPNTHTRRTTNSRRLHSQAAVGDVHAQTVDRHKTAARESKRSISEKGVNAGLVRTVGRSTAENSRFPTIDDPFTDINLGLDSDQLDTDAPEPLVPHQAEPPTLVKHTRLVARPPFSPPNFHSNNSIHLSILFVLRSCSSFNIANSPLSVDVLPFGCPSCPSLESADTPLQHPSSSLGTRNPKNTQVSTSSAAPC